MHNKIENLIAKDLKIDIDYISLMDFLVTGDPVIIRLYLAISDNLIIFLVLLALGFLIVVDSSIAINVL